MKKQSAGILVFKRTGKGIVVLLVHPGGPFWAKKDSWSIPKGELEAGEDILAAARREYTEELGFAPPEGEYKELGKAAASGKTNYIWACEGDAELSKFKPGTFEMEWPPKSGNKREFPEMDRVDWFSLAKAKQKLFANQQIFIDRLAANLDVSIDQKIDAASNKRSTDQISMF